MRPSRQPLSWWAAATAVAYGIFLAGVVLVGLFCAVHQYAADDVRGLCRAHRGVASVSDTTFGAGAGVATVVCRDGYVGQLR